MEETLEILQDNLGQALIDTAYMVVVSAIIGVVLGTLVALLLYLTENRLFTPNHALNVIVGFIVNAIRSLHSYGGAHSCCAIDSGRPIHADRWRNFPVDRRGAVLCANRGKRVFRS